MNKVLNPPAPDTAAGKAARVDIMPLHLSINRAWEDGRADNIHLLENPDLNVILKRGQNDTTEHVPTRADFGRVLLSLGVDNNDHDEIQYQQDGATVTEMLRRSIDILEAALDAHLRASA